jgi:hypothetical protein
MLVGRAFPIFVFVNYVPFLLKKWSVTFTLRFCFDLFRCRAQRHPKLFPGMFIQNGIDNVRLSRLKRSVQLLFCAGSRAGNDLKMIMSVGVAFKVPTMIEQFCSERNT